MNLLLAQYIGQERLEKLRQEAKAENALRALFAPRQAKQTCPASKLERQNT